MMQIVAIKMSIAVFDNDAWIGGSTTASSVFRRTCSQIVWHHDVETTSTIASQLLSLSICFIRPEIVIPFSKLLLLNLQSKTFLRHHQTGDLTQFFAELFW